jgi:hypothetical protein
LPTRTLCDVSHAASSARRSSVIDLNAKRSSHRSDVMLVIWGLVTGFAGGSIVLFGTNRTSRVLGGVTLIVGVASAVAGWRGGRFLDTLNVEQTMRRSGVMGIGTGLLLLSGANQTLSDPNRAGRVLGGLVLGGGVVAIVVGGLTLWQSRKRRT